MSWSGWYIGLPGQGKIVLVTGRLCWCRHSTVPTAARATRRPCNYNIGYLRHGKLPIRTVFVTHMVVTNERPRKNVKKELFKRS